uniref:Orf97 n=1 Tax=Picobiliphyte sp. MS584-11 TaxID=1157699 RepID=A0A2H4R889_9EUKA|nr:orf97 [Picobiliphyte sp. MS584-11]
MLFIVDFLLLVLVSYLFDPFWLLSLVLHYTIHVCKLCFVILRSSFPINFIWNTLRGNLLSTYYFTIINFMLIHVDMLIFICYLFFIILPTYVGYAPA